MLPKGINLTTQRPKDQRQNPWVLSPLSLSFLLCLRPPQSPSGAPTSNEKNKLAGSVSWKTLPGPLLPQQHPWCCRKKMIKFIKTTSSCKNQTIRLRMWMAQILLMFGVISWFDKWRIIVSAKCSSFPSSLLFFLTYRSLDVTTDICGMKHTYTVPSTCECTGMSSFPPTFIFVHW